jgi:exodeoxyribonuclease VII small subunit
MVERNSKNKARAGEPATTTGVEEPLHFEGAVQRLAQIVEELEAGELPLEESLKLFEEGVKLSRISQTVLDRAEARVEELLSVSSDGKANVREIDPE